MKNEKKEGGNGRIRNSGQAKSPTLAGVLSALICGLGQVYGGRAGRGMMLFLIFGVLVALSSAVWLFGIIDAFTETGK